MAGTAKNSKSAKSKGLGFLWEVSKTLATVNDAQNLVLCLKEIFQKYFSVNNFQIFIKDESTSTLRDFVKSWIIIEKNQQQEIVQNIFDKLKSSADKGFIINSKLLKFTAKESLKEQFFSSLNKTKNLLYFPVLNEKTLTGVIEISFDSVNKDVQNSEFLMALRIAMTQINMTVVNKILNRHLFSTIKLSSLKVILLSMVWLLNVRDNKKDAFLKLSL